MFLKEARRRTVGNRSLSHEADMIRILSVLSAPTSLSDSFSLSLFNCFLLHRSNSPPPQVTQSWYHTAARGFLSDFIHYLVTLRSWGCAAVSPGHHCKNPMCPNHFFFLHQNSTESAGVKILAFIPAFFWHDVTAELSARCPVLF